MMTKVRFAIVGTNFITDQFLQAAKEDDRFELSAVYSRTDERAKEYAAKYNVEHTFTDLQSLAESDCIDAVYIASPNSLHCEQTLLFLQNKKHVLCEKPFATNANEAKMMIETAKKYGVLVMEAMKLPTFPSFQELKKQIHKIGQVRKFIMVHCQYSSRYDAYLRGEVLNAFKPEFSNGALMDIGVYTVAPIVHLFGRPKSIKANAFMLESGVDGEGSILLHYGDIEGTCVYSKISNTYLPSEIQGEKGSIVINQLKNFHSVTIRYHDGSYEEIAVPHAEHDLCYEISEFLDTVILGKTESEMNTFERSLITMEILAEARKQMGLVYKADKLE